MLLTKCKEIISNDRKRRKKIKSNSSEILDTNVKKEWIKYCELVEKQDELLKNLNKNIDRFNLIVPMMKSQMFHFNLKREADKIFTHCKEEYSVDIDPKTNDAVAEKDDNQQQNPLTLMNSISILENMIKRIVVLLKTKDKR